MLSDIHQNAQNMVGRVITILIADHAGSELYSVQSAELEAGRGIVGDRYYKKAGTFSRALEQNGDFEVTLIESEEIQAFNRLSGADLAPHAFRRNIVTAGIKLNDLVGSVFMVGDVELEAVRLCEPCRYLADRLGDAVLEHMLHKCGIRAIIRRGGKISKGNRVYPC